MAGATALLDANGVAIAVGDTVKLVGVISETNPFDNRYNEVVITLSHPIAAAAEGNVAPGANLHSPGAVKIISCAPTMLVKGA